MTAGRAKGLLAAALMLAAAPAAAQTPPNWGYGFVPTPAQWNAAFAGKQDYLGAPPLLTTGGTMVGRLVTAPPSATTAGFNLGPGTAPPAPVNGDLWVTSASIFARVNGSTVDLVNGACPTCAVTNATNVFTAAQTVSLNAGALPAAIAGTALRAAGANAATTRIVAEGYGAIGALTVARADGTAAAPTQVLSGEQVGGFNAFAWGSNAAWNGPTASMRVYAGENVTGAAWGSKICWGTTPTGSTTIADSLCQLPGGTITTANSMTVNGSALTVSGGAASTAAVVSSTGASANAYLIVQNGTREWVVGAGADGACGSGTVLVFYDVTAVGCRGYVASDGGWIFGASLTSPGPGNLNLTGGALLNNGTAPTGTGAYARATSPVFTTPSLGVATATSINGLTITTTAAGVLRLNDSLAQTLLGIGVSTTSNAGGHATAFGWRALANAGASLGIDEVAVGARALENDVSGFENTAVGDSAMNSCTSCNNNTVVGSSAAASMSSGSTNVAIGVSAMEQATGGPVQNVAIGNSALNVVGTGSTNNVAVGGAAGQNATGAVNHATLVGDSAGFNLTTGAYNTMLGAGAGNSGSTPITTGTTNTLVGGLTGSNLNSSNSTALGNGAIITASNQVVLGNGSVTGVYMGGTHLLAAVDLPQTWTGLQAFGTNALYLLGASGGNMSLNCAATCGSSAIVFPSGTTDFSATGGTNFVLKQSSTGAAITVGALAASNLSNGTTGSGSIMLATAPTASALTVTGSFTATGLVTNADLANPSVTVNGTICTLGSACAPGAGPIAVGDSVTGGTANGVFYNSASTFGNTAAGTNGQLLLGVTSGAPAWGTLSGDATITNAGALTLSSVATAGTTGSSTAIPVVTIDVKGRVTTISTAAVVAPAGTLSGATLAAGVTGSSLTSLGTLTSLAVSGAITGGATAITSASASALAVGLAGATNPAFQVDASTASQAAGFKVTGAATGGTVALAAIDSGSNANVTINAKGSGTIGIGSVSTGAVTITPATTLSAALTYGGVALSNSVTGTGAMALGTSPTFTTGISVNGTINSTGTIQVTPASGVDGLLRVFASGAGAAYMQLTTAGASNSFQTDATGDFNVTADGVIAGVMKMVHAGSAANTLVLKNGAIGIGTATVGTSGSVNVTGPYYTNGTKGVTCSGALTVVASITITNGIVTAATGTGGTCS